MGRMTAGGPQFNTPRRRHVDTARVEELLASVASIFFGEGFTSVSMEELARRLKCSKATLYTLAATKEQLVVRITRRFFAAAAAGIERTVAGESDPRARILSYFHGVGQAMGAMSSAFYDDMLAYGPTAEIYARNTEAAATRVHELIEAGIASGDLRRVHGTFASQLGTLGIQGIQSGELLRNTGMDAGTAFSELGDLLLYGLDRR
ncbi:TetR/AcrR family transcriptional regulator [Sinomonas sp. P47F7]|uniref:TetR/AcrR family transcriptional regulator n=1 Tax=Sinomonas sp. P47F7 TaxID=3410987 RepID=UPI003BF4E4BF